MAVARASKGAKLKAVKILPGHEFPRAQTDTSELEKHILHLYR